MFFSQFWQPTSTDDAILSLSLSTKNIRNKKIIHKMYYIYITILKSIGITCFKHKTFPFITYICNTEPRQGKRRYTNYISLENVLLLVTFRCTFQCICETCIKRVSIQR